jgi:hypothetical protein
MAITSQVRATTTIGEVLLKDWQGASLAPNHSLNKNTRFARALS